MFPYREQSRRKHEPPHVGSYPCHRHSCFGYLRCNSDLMRG